ncbi:MAG: A/G-specific adenine glycosylase [Chloroflexi bacterium]|nr:A/G-specific adenine glycosylase [Chloroflexota bacterium]
MRYHLPTMLQDNLINWFQQHRVDLPWRAQRDPYHVWISEIMLQQTQVTTVIPYFERFIERFPTVVHLAAAPLDDVLKLWEGLGYYSRARNLHAAAQMIIDKFDGQFPNTVDDLRHLPGVGDYTAGAIANFAFGADAPLVDGNVIRVLTRLFDIDADVTRAAGKRAVWDLAAELVPTGRGPLWNEGLMELGRLVCTPRSPACEACPVQTHCQALARGTQEERPVKPKRKPTPHYDVTAAVITRDDGRILIAQRPTDKMLGGLWEFPGGKREPGESLRDCLVREIEEELSLVIDVGPQITTVKHAYSHFKITLYAFACEVRSGEATPLGVADFAWVTADQFDAYAFPVTDQKIIAALRSGGGQLGMDFNEGLSS